jgi:hypothetical protein
MERKTGQFSLGFPQFLINNQILVITDVKTQKNFKGSKVALFKGLSSNMLRGENAYCSVYGI